MLCRGHGWFFALYLRGSFSPYTGHTPLPSVVLFSLLPAYERSHPRHTETSSSASNPAEFIIATHPPRCSRGCLTSGVYSSYLPFTLEHRHRFPTGQKVREPDGCRHPSWGVKEQRCELEASAVLNVIYLVSSAKSALRCIAWRSWN